MIRQLEELNGMVQAWIDRQDAEGCGGESDEKKGLLQLWCVEVR